MIEQIGTRVARMFRVEGEPPVTVFARGVRKHIKVIACEVQIIDGYREQILLTGSDVTRAFPIAGASIMYDNVNSSLPLEQAPVWALRALESLRAAHV